MQSNQKPQQKYKQESPKLLETKHTPDTQELKTTFLKPQKGDAGSNHLET